MTFQEIEIKNRETAEEIMKLINFMTNDDNLAKAFAEKLAGEHRTIQQNFWRMILYTAHRYIPLVEGRTDLRNEASLALAKLIDDKSPHLPFV